jgi:aspartate carbamoyltransferase catalytic subunit
MKIDLLTTTVLSVNEIEAILDQAQLFSEGMIWQPKQKTFVANLFYEPSTRTKSSFEVAERQIGEHTF